MAHYAFIDETNTVVEVIVGRDETDLVDGVESWEKHYEAFRSGLRCVRTSYNTHGGVHLLDGTPFRKNYAVIGGTYDEDLDAFIPPKPDEEDKIFVLNETTCLWEESK